MVHILENSVHSSSHRTAPREGLGNENSSAIGVVNTTNQFFHRGLPSIEAPFTQYLTVDETDTAVSHHTIHALHCIALHCMLKASSDPMVKSVSPERDKSGYKGGPRVSS